MMRRALVFGLVMLAVAGCATGLPTFSLPTHPEPQSLSESLANLKGDTVIDLAAALDTANAHSDAIGAACWPALTQFITQTTGTATPTVDQIKGVFSAWEKARVERMAIEGKGLQSLKLPDYLRLGCAALLMDERDFAIRLAVFIAALGPK